MSTPISYFDKRYYNLYAPHLSKRTVSEVAFIDSFLKRNSTILDAACGYGRHAIELAKAGHRVTGIDASHEMIEIAKQNPELKNIRNISFHESYIQTFEHEPFNASLLLFSVLGYSTEENDIEMLKALGRLTKKDGLLILDGRNRLTVEHITEGAKETTGPETHWLTGKEWHMQHLSKDGKTSETSILLYTLNEVKEMLQKSGFVIEEVFSDFSKKPFDENSDRFVIVARKTQ